LCWDTAEDRQKWRNDYLLAEDRIPIKVPIRYGRYSTKRKCYTMVFSSSLSDSQMGCGYVLSHSNATEDKIDLMDKTTAMGRAEGIVKDIVADWASVAILINPKSPFHDELAKSWRLGMGNKLSSHKLLKPIHNDPYSLLNKDGMLNIAWPRTCNNNAPLDGYDYLLATQTLPRHKDGENKYPSAEEIAEYINFESNEDYFTQNRNAGITTFQDKEILNNRNKSIDKK
jgi:hypothetical protein